MIQKYNVLVKKAVNGAHCLFSVVVGFAFLLSCCDHIPALTSPKTANHHALVIYMDDDVIDLSDAQTYKETMQRLDQESVCPCAVCDKRMSCEQMRECKSYAEWRRKYMRRRFG